MKRAVFVVGILGLFILVGSIVSTWTGSSWRRLALAGGERDAAYHDQITRGLWREGQAVFSDVPLLDALMNQTYVRGYKPKQPIAFNHQVHVEKNKIECQYCHFGVGKSAYASIPAVETCMGCHKVVKTDSPEIKKLAGYYERKEPIPWEPVTNLPEHAVFNHNRHIKAGVGCHTCHGQVQKMDEVEKVASLKMGFCVSCHRDKGASIDCAVCHH